MDRRSSHRNPRRQKDRRLRSRHETSGDAVAAGHEPPGPNGIKAPLTLAGPSPGEPTKDSLVLGDRREILVLGLALAAHSSAGSTAYASVDVSVSMALSSDAVTVRLPEVATIKDVRAALRQRSGPRELKLLLDAGAPLLEGMAGILYPVLVLGGLYANYFSTKELDDISTLEKTRRPLSDFWSGICVGVIIGVWAGVNYGPSLKYAWETLDWVRPLAATKSCSVNPLLLMSASESRWSSRESLHFRGPRQFHMKIDE
eukprot:Skav213353  [mRNA]  locus=scaffold317:92112:101749:- [translate_table: standard]